MKRLIIGVLVSLAVAGTSAVGQNVSKRGTTAATFLSISQGARGMAMGGAFVAVVNDPSAMYWNPAGLTEVEGISFLVDNTTWIADIHYNYIGATVSAGPVGVLGLNVTMSNIADMAVTTVDKQDGTGEVFGVSDLAVGLSYAIKLTDAFSIGFTPKFVHQKIWKMSATAFAIDLGVKYRTPFEGFTLGMSISNFGTKMQMQGNNSLVLYDPDPSGSGNNGRIPAQLATEEWELPLNFRVGLAYDLPLEEIGRLTLAADAQHPSDDYESVSAGGEFEFNEVLYIRGGYKTLFLTDSEEGLALGLGVRQYVIGNVRLGLDYAYQEFARLASAQKITLSIQF
ncbi:MAG: PorV/PorQ family protein [Bacteroidetes bacterium]|jgi:long-subunit fatty acid transport protein|nr:PorV/PorQ family protein [Bacteroidota bacterium]